MSRKLIIFSLAAAVLIVAGTALVPFLSTTLGNMDDESGPPTVSLAGLATGSFVEIELPSSRVFVLRDFDEQVYVFSVPYSDAAYWLPEFDWSHPGIPCAKFEPDNKDGFLVPDGRFRCVLPDHGEFFRYEHSWSYAGNNQGYRTADMKVADHEMTEDSVLIRRWE